MRMVDKYQQVICETQDGIEADEHIKTALEEIYGNVYPEDRPKMHEVIAAILGK